MGGAVEVEAAFRGGVYPTRRNAPPTIRRRSLASFSVTTKLALRGLKPSQSRKE
jgi:hypothetical protein